MNEAYENLANAIVELAILDYKKAKACKNYGKVKECEKFFNSKWCKMLTNLDINKIIWRL